MPALGWMRADGVGEPQILIENERFLIPLSWHPDGRRLLVHRETDEGENDLLLLHLSGDSQNGWSVDSQEAFLKSGSRLSNGVFSPDGDWVTNTSNESLRHRLFVRRLDGMEAVKVIPLSAFSLSGVSWSLPTSELIFADRAEGQGLLEREVFIAKYRNADNSIVFESPRPWPGSHYTAQEGGVDFSFDPKGDRVLVRKLVDQDGQSKRGQVVWVRNVPELLGE